MKIRLSKVKKNIKNFKRIRTSKISKGSELQKSFFVFFKLIRTSTRPAWAGFKTAEEGRTKIM
jgi:hypothetical protein